MGSGKISTEYTIWCGRCEIFFQESHFRNKADLARCFIGLGWKKISGNFYCPNCAKILKEEGFR